jgi:hypothetical protein
MADNHYGWFERVATGIYSLCPKGSEALRQLGDPDSGTKTEVEVDVTV